MTDEIKTHQLINKPLCGVPLEIKDGVSRVKMATTSEMAVDEHQLVHGGFIFGLADHAAMIAVNHPHVVLGAADVKFLKPVKNGEIVTARATVVERKDKKQIVAVRVDRDDDIVFEGTLTCFVLDKHVLA